MAQENDILDLQRHNAIQDARISNLETKFEMFMQEMRDRDKIRAEETKDFKDEMRDRDNQRRAEIVEIRTSIDSTNKYIRNFFYTSLAAIGAMVLTVLLNLPK